MALLIKYYEFINTLSLNWASCLLYFSYPFKGSTMSSFLYQLWDSWLGLRYSLLSFQLIDSHWPQHPKCSGLLVFTVVLLSTVVLAPYASCFSPLWIHLLLWFQQGAEGHELWRSTKCFSADLNSLHVSWASADVEGKRLETRANLRTSATTKLQTELKDRWLY